MPVLSRTAAPRPGTLAEAVRQPAASKQIFSSNELFAGLVAIGFVNGISERVMTEWANLGPLTAIFNTFDISLIVWAAMLVALTLLLRDRGRAIGPAEAAIAALAAITFLAPVPSLSWLGLGAIGLYLLRPSAGSPVTARAAAILLAITIPMFWGRLLMAAFGNVILQIDATLVSWFVGTTRIGNVVPFADGSGSMWIAPGCSSFTNLSLGLLSTILFAKAFDRPWSMRTIGFGALVCLSIIAINVVRIGLIGLYPAQFELLHGPVGSTVAGWLTTAAILGLCAYGIGRDAPAAA